MYLSHKASKARLKEAQVARDNRAEIVRALSQGQVTRRELVKWGIFTAGGLLVGKSGLNAFAQSAIAPGSEIPTGTPPSPLFGAQPLSQPMPRLNLQQPEPLAHLRVGSELERLPVTRAYWFAWAAFYPNSEVVDTADTAE